MSSNINEVIRAVLNSSFIYLFILQKGLVRTKKHQKAQKAPKAQKVQKRNQAKT